MSGNYDVIVFFRFMANLQPFGSRIPDAWCMKLTFSLKKTFNFTKPENKTWKSLLSKGAIFYKKCWHFAKKNNADISKIKGILVLESIFSKIIYI